MWMGWQQLQYSFSSQHHAVAANTKSSSYQRYQYTDEVQDIDFTVCKLTKTHEQSGRDARPARKRQRVRLPQCYHGGAGMSPKPQSKRSVHLIPRLVRCTACVSRTNRERPQEIGERVEAAVWPCRERTSFRVHFHHNRLTASAAT